MENTNLIYRHETYQELLGTLAQYEKDRVYCGHNMGHFLDVARLMYIYVLEEGLDYSKDMVYTTALLHDIGRVRQYEDGTDHALASAQLAEEFLKETSFSDREKDLIIEAIAKHRKENTASDYSALFYRADKASRPCFACPVEGDCNWDKDKKNMRIGI